MAYGGMAQSQICEVRSGILANILEHYGNIPEYYGTFQSTIEHSGVLWNIPEYYGAFGSTMERSRVLRPSVSRRRNGATPNS